MTDPRLVSDLLDVAELVLSDSTHIFEDHDNRQEAEELLAHVLAMDVDDLDPDEMLTRSTRDRYLALIARRAAGEPFPFLTGFIEFYGLELKVKPGPFVPRPSSELVVDRAVRRLRRRREPVMVDICTGAGPIALAVAAELPRAEVWGADIDTSGLAQARENAKDLEIENVSFKKADMYDGLPRKLRGNIDVITGHVPYVPIEELEDLPREVKAYEPIHTLSDQSADGLYLMRRAIDDAKGWLKPGGWLLLEISDDLAKKIRRLCAQAGLIDEGVASDNDGLSVVVEARSPLPDEPAR